jgi:hypothetical protein
MTPTLGVDLSKTGHPTPMYPFAALDYPAPSRRGKSQIWPKLVVPQSLVGMRIHFNPQKIAASGVIIAQLRWSPQHGNRTATVWFASQFSSTSAPVVCCWIVVPGMVGGDVLR